MRKIWNHAPYPVWSLVTRDEKGDAHMNICTYVTPISMHPKEFIIGVYYGTATYDHVVRDRRACLQLLSKDQIAYVPLLGKKSAKKTSSQNAKQENNRTYSYV
ncbi:MAG: flavin reductase family protein [Candidatus Pacebacteria bacterium]|nr:flavin reductase family protein [Candidatus Paceibacterota bacterium]